MPFTGRHCKIETSRTALFSALFTPVSVKAALYLLSLRVRPLLFGLFFTITATLCALSSPVAAYADFYSYVDANGVLHISNVPVSNKFNWMMPEKSMGPGNATGGVLSYDTLIYNVSRRYGVDPNLIKAVVRAESDYNPAAVSRAGARGLMQLMPETARMLGVKNIHDPADNVSGGTRYLSGLIRKFNGRLPMALAAYNAGEGAVRKYGQIPPFKETQRYVKKVLYFYDSYSGAGR